MWANRNDFEFVAMLRHNASIISVKAADIAAVELAYRDPKDNFLLALVLAADADLLVSSDDDLLSLHPWRGIPILSSTAFLSCYHLA